nr:unnamed protein product [Digitaria exilis]
MKARCLGDDDAAAASAQSCGEAGRRRDDLLLMPSAARSALRTRPAAGHNDLARHLPLVPVFFNWEYAWYDDGGGDIGGSPAPAATSAGATEAVAAAIAAALLGVPGVDSHRKGTAPGRRL